MAHKIVCWLVIEKKLLIAFIKSKLILTLTRTLVRGLKGTVA
jgi:hypothetical protein